MARGRTIKFSPKRGKLTRRQAKRAVEKVVFGKDSNGKIIPSDRHSKTRLRVGVPGVELQNPDMLEIFVETGLLLPDVPLKNPSIELLLWVDWPADRADFSLYKMDPETGEAYRGDSGLMMEVQHTQTHFDPQLPDSVWENTPRVHWATFSRLVEDMIKTLIQTQHLRQWAWPLLPEGDLRWIAYFNEFEETLGQDRHQESHGQAANSAQVSSAETGLPSSNLREVADNS